jgi:hypothetical protein
METVTRPVDEIDGDPPFWRPDSPSWRVLPARERRSRPPRRPVLGALALVVLAFATTFLAWVSAEPLWLVIGHGERGTATVTRCPPGTAPPGCVTFRAADGGFVAEDMALLGADRVQLARGASVPAQMVSVRGDRVYAADPTGLRLRAGVGLALVLLCGLGLAWATGATRLDDPRSRRRAVLASIGLPLLVTLGFLAATW